MAFNFSANQFDETFKAKRLGNWEASVRQPQRPRLRTGCTKFVSDDRGHLLPGLTRSSPWMRGPLTAWDHPKRITRAHVKQMEAENNKRLATWLKRSAHVPLLQQEPPATPEDAASSSDRAPTTPEESPKERRATRQSSARSSARSSSLVRPLASLSEIKVASGSGRPRTTSTRSSSREHSLKLPAPAPSINSQQSAPPLAKAYSTMQAAKTLAEESRTHQPLADTVHDPLFCSLQNKKAKNPGLALTAPTDSESTPPRRRPSTSHPLRKLTEMDLAIRWDLRLPGDKNCCLPKVPSAVFNTVIPLEAPEPQHVKMAWEEKSSVKEAPVHHNKIAIPKNPELAKKRSRSTPNLVRRACTACEHTKEDKAPTENVQDEFKQAFKAGKPNNWRPHTAAAKQVVVPKPKQPFSKRSYSIGTLAPPFSLWPDGTRRQDYPDHWRLASVYQHSYKPIDLRKKPLLRTVFQ